MSLETWQIGQRRIGISTHGMANHGVQVILHDYAASLAEGKVQAQE
jgi:hypothetical protein